MVGHLDSSSRLFDRGNQQLARGVKAETLALVIKEVRRAGIDRIELVLDKKKTVLCSNHPFRRTSAWSGLAGE